MSSTRSVLVAIVLLCAIFVGASCGVSWANLAVVSSSGETTAEQAAPTEPPTGTPPEQPAEEPPVAEEEEAPPATSEEEALPPAETAYSVGAVEGLQGVALITVTVLRTQKELKKGESVSITDLVTTTENSKLWLKLKEGTDVSLGQHSGVRIVYLDVSDSGTVFHVHVAEARCPPGQRCVQGRCLPVVR